MNLEILLGCLDFIDNKKSFIEITPFLESKNINISYTSNNELPTISNLNFAFFEDRNIMSEIEGLFDFIDRNKDYSLFPLLVIIDGNIIFNGFIERVVANIQSGLNFNDDYVKNYNYTVIHKAKELSNKYIAKIISYQNITSKKYFNYLFEDNPRITRYNQTEYDLTYSQDVEVLELNLEKNLIYNSNTIKVGDVLHRINTVSGTEIKTSHIIKEIKYFREHFDGQEIIKQIYYNNFDSTNVRIKINGLNIELFDMNNTIITSGVIDSGTYRYEFESSSISGFIEFNDFFKFIYEYNDFGFNWEDNVAWNWEDNVDWIFGVSIYDILVETNVIQIKTFEDVIIPSGTTQIKTKIGYDVNVLDNSANTEIANPIIKFNSANELINNLSNEYLFNYSFDNYGNVQLYTNTVEDLLDDEHILQIGNNDSELLDILNKVLTNCIESDSIYTRTSSGDFSVEFSSFDLIEENRYAIYLDSDCENIEFLYGGGNLDVEEIEYCNGRYFIFDMPTGYTSINIRLQNSISDSFTINNISMTEALYLEQELNSIYKISSIDYDATGLRTALHIPNYNQVERVETIEQINTFSPAENTYHKISDVVHEPNKTYTTGKEDSVYYKLGQGINYMSFPLIFTESAFLNEININISRNSLENGQCLFAQFIRNDVEIVFGQIVVGSDITSNSVNINPTFLYKKSTDNITCKLEKMEYEKVDIVSNSFVSGDYTIYSVNDKIRIPTDGNINICTVTSSTPSSVSFTVSDGSTINGEDLFVLSDADNSISSTNFLEVESTNIFEDGEDYLDISGTINANRSIVKTISIQKSWVARYPVVNIGDSYNGTPKVALIQEDDSDTFTITYNSSAVHTDPDYNSSEFEWYFKKLLTYDLVYIEILNYQTNEWEQFRVKNYNPSTGQLTLWDTVDINNYGINNQAQFRRVYITNTVDFGVKSSEDDIYEAYITSNRNAFGFNLQVDQNAISDTINIGNMYLEGNILSGVYNIIYTSPRYTEEGDAVDRYGYVEEVFTETINDSDTYVSLSSNQLRYNLEPIIKTNIGIFYEAFNKIVSNKDLNKIQLVKLYHKLLPDGYGLFSVEKKVWNVSKSGRIIIELQLEKVVA